MDSIAAHMLFGVSTFVALADIAQGQAETHVCFDELPLAHTYAVDDHFSTLGIDVVVSRFFASESMPISSGSASVEHFPAACQTEPTLNMSLTEACLGFEFAAAVGRLEFQYGDFSDVLNLEVNGELALFHGFENAPSTLGGVQITNTSNGPGGAGQVCGSIALVGSMSSLRIGGSSLWLDCFSLGSPTLAGTRFVRGDTNATGSIDMSDAVNVLGYLFLGKPTRLVCDDAADVDDDGQVQLSDAVGLLNFLFLGSRAPAAPFVACGLDETEDDLTCAGFPACVAN